MATYNELLLDAMVRHQIGLLRFSGHVRNRIWRLLDATEADLRQQIRDRLRRGAGDGLTPANVRRMEQLLEGLRETRVKAWTEINVVMLEELRAFAVAEAGFEARILETIFPVDLGLRLPDPVRLRSMVTTQPFDGKTLKEMLADVRSADIRRIDQQIKIGMVQGESIPQISRRIVGTVAKKGADGVTQITRRNAETIARTAINGIGAEARAEFALLNEDLAPQEVFVATLDSRTTPICRSLDGNLYDVGKGPRLPLHPGERSLYAPVVDGEVIGERPMREFTSKQLVREYAEEQGLGKIKGDKRDNLPHGHKGAFDAFARKRMRELTGRVPAKTSYSEFLKRQSATFQDDVLGPTRGVLFRRGGLTLDKFVDREGAEIPLSELARTDAEAFRASGLDPDRFR